MPSIPLHPRTINPSTPSNDNPLPQLLQTPSGLAILELQGTINVPSPEDDQEENTITDENESNNPSTAFETPIGKLMFPDYSPLNPDDTKWMKRVYLYVGRYQRMTGEVKKLGQPIALVQRRQPTGEDGEGGGEGDELEIVEVVKYKLFFKNRPEPVNDS